MSAREDRGSSADSTFLVALIVAAAAAELWMAWRYYGFYTGDDVEVLGEAFRVVMGTKYPPWDIRCLFVPDVIVAPFIWIGTKLGVHDVRALVVMATIPSIAANAISTLLVHALALRWTAERRIALAAAALFALHWIPLGFSSTVYPRTVATACILAAVDLVVANASTVGAVAAGAFCGIAFADRFSEAVFLIPILILARRRAFAILGGFAVAVTLAVGLSDFITWGEWFGSVRKFAELTLFRSDFASLQKHQSAVWYLTTLPRWLSPALLPLMWVARRRRRELLILLAIPLVLLSLVAHKELRYLAGIIPFACLLAAIGFGEMKQRRIATALLAIGIAWNLYGVRFLRNKSMPAVAAARKLGADPAIRTVVMSQLWAYGGQLYFGERMAVIDVGTPPRELARVLPGADAACLYESDLTPQDRATLAAAGFDRPQVFREASARDVLVFRRVSRR